MKNKVLAALILCVGAAAFCLPLLAHHGSAAYEDTVTEFKPATVTKFSWANPHALLYFDAKNPKNGKLVHMVVETAAPQALRLIGWSKASMAPGDIITVRMFVSRNGNPAGRLNKIVLADGTELHDTVLGNDNGTKTRFDPPAK
jgi:uncharacterized protein DUF6152